MSLRKTSGLLGLLVLIALPSAGAEKRPSKQYSIEQFMATTAVSGGSFSPDEKEILFSWNRTGVYNVYSVAVAGGEPRQLTDSTSTTYAVSYFPSDRRFLFTRDQAGNELNHLYVQELDGNVRDLTPGDKLKATFGGWTRDKKSFYVWSNERDAKFFDIYLYDAATYQRSLFFQNSAGLTPEDISPDGKWISLSKPNTTADNDLFVYRVETKELKKISEHTGTASFDSATFDPASRSLLLLTNEGAEFTRVRRYDLTTGRTADVEKAEWDVMSTAYSENGRYRVTSINRDANTQIKLYDGKSGKPVALPKLPAVNVTSIRFSPSEKRMLFYAVGDRSPSNLYVHDFASGKTRRLTDTLTSEVDPADLVDSEIVRFKSFDGMTIPGVLYRPHQASSSAKAPAVLVVHGGPGGQAREGYNSSLQFLANHGYVLLDINNRGSSGYGKTFYTADDGKHGREPLWDCVEAKKYLASLPYVDGNRIAIMGGSYGGYMVASALAFKPEVFDVGVNIFGVTNWVRTLQSIPPYWEAQRAALYQEIGNPDTQLEFLRETSPLFHADKIRKPLLVVQGKNDPRVLKIESDELVEAVRKNGVPVEYLVFDDEGHGFSKKKNQISAWSTIQTFLDKHLKGKS